MTLSLMYSDLWDQPIKECGYRVHGIDYFAFSKMEPEFTGLYELLFSVHSSYHDLIERRLFIPIFYYDEETLTWYHGQDKFSIEENGVIGWRIIE